jgi:ribonucleoside-diphosphate reductase subunit M1
MLLLNEDGGGFVNNRIADLVNRRGEEIDAQIVHGRDLEMTYFGYKTLERSYLLKLDEERVVERIQYLWMRVALGIHCCRGLEDGGEEQPFTKEEEDDNLLKAFETYDLMSRGYFTHASPTLFHAGTTHPQLSSCFLVQMSDDSIHGIYDTLKRCAVISKVSNIRCSVVML